MISGKSFAERCAWVIDPRYPDRPSFVYALSHDGDWVFINGDFLQEFLRRLPLIRTKRFTVIVHNTDRPFGHAELYALLPVTYHVYAVNCAIQHAHVTQIPLGFVDRQLPLLPGFKGGSSERPIEAYMNFLDQTNAPKRRECRESLANDPRVTQASGLSVPEYLIDLGRSKFVICPEGTGMDTHRVYESLFCGATPVVLHGPLDPLYQRLPVCIVNKWTDPFYVPPQREKDWECPFFLT
jgi:hypothetical protein